MTALYNFDAHFGYPGMGTPVDEIQAPTAHKWGKPFDLQFRKVRIDGAARDAGNTGFTDVLRPGLLLGLVASTGELKQWDPAATDGTHRIAGILPNSLKMVQGSTDTDRLVSVIVGGSVTARGLAQASSSTYGIDGTDEEYNIRAQMSKGFQFDDDPMGFLEGNYAGVMVIAATATLSELHNGSLIVVRGAGSAVTLTLPATPKRGLRYRVYNASAQNLVIAAGTADTMVVFNDLTADSIALQTAGDLIGGSFEIIGDGTGWLVIPSTFADGVIVQTLTIAT